MTHTEAVNTLASERYLLDEMTAPEREDFEAHYFECAECADDVRMGGLLEDGVKAGFVAAPQVARIAAFTPVPKRTGEAFPTSRVLRPAWYRSAALPWAVAATLAVAVGYQSVVERDRGVPTAEALTTVMLRPASRGVAPTVSLGSPHVALALDVDPAGASELSYELRDSSGSLVTSGRVPAPAAGAPLLLVIPTFTLKPEQQYILAVRDAARADRTLGDFAFAAAL